MYVVIYISHHTKFRPMSYYYFIILWQRMKDIIRGDVKMDIVLLLLEGSEPFFVIGWEMFFLRIQGEITINLNCTD